MIQGTGNPAIIKLYHEHNPAIIKLYRYHLARYKDFSAYVGIQ